MDDRQVTPQYFNVAGELAPVCAQLVLKCLYLTRTGRTDLTVNRKYAGNIRHTKEHSLWSKIGTIIEFHQPLETLQTLRFCWKHDEGFANFECLKDASFARDFQDSKFKVRWSVMSIGIRKTLVPIS